MNLLASIAETDIHSKIEGFGNILGFGGQIVLLGMGMVFTVLIVIWASIVGLKYLFANFDTEKKAETKPVENVTAPTTHAPAGLNDEIVAAIAAAIAMAEAESSGLKFRVVSFRRK